MKKLVVVGFGAILIILIVVVVIAVSLQEKTDVPSSSFETSYFTSCQNPERSSTLGKFSNAAVSSDAVPCAQIAKDILLRNGTAADAAVAGMFCVGVINAQSSGLGGGFVATYYSKREGKAYALDAREVAPAAAFSGMYDEQSNPALQGEKTKWYEMKPSANLKGGLAVAVPGESAGLYALFQRFGGSVPWKDLLEPTIKLCEEGYQLTWYTGGIMYPMRADFMNEPSMSIFLNESEGRILHEGETVYRKQLAKTLRVLQEEPEALTKGSLSEALASDLSKFGGIITQQDLSNYSPKWREPVTFELQNGGYTLHSFPPPGSGLVLGLILNILDEFNFTKSSLEPEEAARTHHRFAEAFKFSYAQRYRMGDLSQDEALELAKELTSETFASSLKAKLPESATKSDPAYYGTRLVPGEDDGTAHLSVLAPDGDAVAITSSVNMAFGAGIRSESTGIIYNNEMADFTTLKKLSKPGQMLMNKNVIKPGNRPLSSMSPSIILDSSGGARLVVGAAGGVKIPSASAWVIARDLWMGEDLKEAVDACRSHHSLLPMKLAYEKGFPKDILSSLEEKQHDVTEYRWKSVVQAVGRDDQGNIVANSDFRKSGEIQGF